MKKEFKESTEATDFSLALGGPLYQLYLSTRLARPPLEYLHRRIIAFLAICWLPLFLSTLFTGKAMGGVHLPFLKDIETQITFLISLPLLLFADLLVHRRIEETVGHFPKQGLITKDNLPRFEAAVATALRWRNSKIAEVFLLLLSFALGQYLWRIHIALEVPTWFSDGGLKAKQLTPVGWWYASISLSLFRFLLIRWLFRLIIWHRFLWQVSRIPLRINALHPDNTGGLWFVGYSIFAFVPVLLAIIAVQVGEIANRILYEGAVLPQFRFEILSLIGFLILTVMISQFFFVTQMAAARRREWIAYSIKASQYVEEFKQKWLSDNAKTKEDFLGSSDIQSLADLNSSFEVARQMRLFPIGTRGILLLTAFLVVPFLPLLLTMMPLSEMINRVFKILV